MHHRYVLLRLYLVIISTFYVAFQSTDGVAKQKEIKCDKFNFSAEIISKKPLKISFQITETDLPGNTEVVVSIGKSYYVNQNMEAYPIDYYRKFTTIEDLKKKQSVEIDLAKERMQIERSRKIQSQLGEKFVVKKIDSDIELEILVPLQRDIKFGKSNQNLTGKMVTESEGLELKIIEVSKKFIVNTDGGSSELLGKSNPSLSPDNLTINTQYKLSRRTPVWPKSGSDFLGSLPPGSVIKIISKARTDSPEYLIEAYLNGNRVHGWVSSTALWGQDLKVIE